MREAPSSRSLQTCSDTGGKGQRTVPEAKSSTPRRGEASESESTRSDRTSYWVQWEKGHAATRHVHQGTIVLWKLQANELSDEQAKKVWALHPCVKRFEERYFARTTCLGRWAKFLFGTVAVILEQQRMERRGAEGAEATPCGAWETGGVATGAAMETNHTREVLAGEDREFVGSSGGAVSAPRRRCKGWRSDVTGLCKVVACKAVAGCSKKLKTCRTPQNDGWQAEPT